MLVSDQNDLKVGMHETTDAVLTDSDAAVLVRSHRGEAHVEQIIERLVKHFKSVKKDCGALLHARDDLVESADSFLFSELILKIAALEGSIRFSFLLAYAFSILDSMLKGVNDDHDVAAIFIKQILLNQAC